MSHAPHPDMEPILAMWRATPQPRFEAMSPEAGRAWFTETHVRINDPLPPCSARDLTVGGIPCRLLNEEAGPGRIVLVHGGGWTFGNPATHERCGRLLALDAAMPVLLPDYRLAPEHPCPAAIEDILAVLAALPPGPRVLAGDSSGANVALAVAETGVPLDMLSLWYGCFAPIFDTRSHQECGDGSFGLTTERMRWYWSNWQGAAADPRAVALDGPVEKLPRTHLLAAGLDCLRDDTLILSGKLAAAGIRYRLDVLPGLVHGFLQMTALARPAREAVTIIADEIRHTLNRE
jgi:acetyl esterase